MSSCRCDREEIPSIPMLLFFKLYLRVYFWLCQALTAVPGLSLAAVSGASPWGGFPCAEPRPSDTRASVLVVGGSVFLAF